VPVLQISGSPYNEVVIPPSLDDLREFFHAIPQGEEHATTIRIGALSVPHRMLAKIVQHNLWPVVRRSDLILKRVQFVYAISLRLPFYLCKHILGDIITLFTLVLLRQLGGVIYVCVLITLFYHLSLCDKKGE